MKNKYQYFLLRISVIVFLFGAFSLSASASTSHGTITAPSQYAKVCHDTTCATTAGGVFGIINMLPSFLIPVEIDDTAGVTGQAWGNEVGTITFNPVGGGVSINTATGAMSGYAYSSIGGWMKMNPTGVTPVTINCSGEFNGWAWIGGIGGGWVKFSASGIATPASPADAGATVITDWIPVPCRPVPPGGGGGGSIDYCPTIVGHQSATDFCPTVIVPPGTPVIPGIITPPGTLPIFEVIGETPVPPQTNLPLIIKNLLGNLEIPPRFFDIAVYKGEGSIDERTKTQEKGLFFELLASADLRVILEGRNFKKIDVSFVYIGDTAITQRVIYQTRGFRAFFGELFSFGAGVAEAQGLSATPSTYDGYGAFVVPEKTGFYTMKIVGTNADGSQETVYANAVVVPRGDSFHQWWMFGWHERLLDNAVVTLLVADATGAFVPWSGVPYDEMNPSVSEDGTYGYTVPKGTYKLMISAPDFHTYFGETISFLSSGRIVNDRVELNCKFWNTWGCLLPIKILMIVGIIVILWRYYKHLRKKDKDRLRELKAAENAKNVKNNIGQTPRNI